MKKVRVSRWMAGVIVTALVMIIIAVCTYKSDTVVILEDEFISFDNDWEYVTDKGAIGTTETMTHVDDAADSFVVSNTMPDGIKNGMTLCIKSYNQAVRVALGGVVVYENGFNSDGLFSKNQGFVWHIINLDEDVAGKSISIEYVSTYSPNDGTFGEVYVGTASSTIKTVIVNNMAEFILGIVTLIFAAGMFILSFILSKLHKDYSAEMYIGVYATLISVWTIVETGAIQLFYGNASVVALVADLALMISPIPFMLYIFRAFFADRKKLCNTIAMVFVFICIINTVLSITKLYDLSQTVFITLFAQIVTSLVFIFIAIHDYIRTRHGRLLFYIFSILVLAGTGIADIIKYTSGMPGETARNFRLGFCLYMAAVCIYEYVHFSKYAGEYVEKFALEKMAYEDILTKCKNRMFFNNEMKETQDKISSYKTVGIMIFDMNNLKITNDMYGHDAGDKLLIQCAGAIKKAFGDIANCARIGGDEFGLILKDVEPEKIDECIIKMLDEVESCNYTCPYLLEIAYGYAMFDSRIDRTLDNVFSRADQKMYDKKREMKAKPIVKM